MAKLMSLITDEMADRNAFRGWLQPEARRLAIGISWDKYSQAEARAEMQSALHSLKTKGGGRARITKAVAAARSRDPGDTAAVLAALQDAIAELRRSSPLTADHHAFANEVLDDAIQAVWVEYEESQRLIALAVTAALRSGADRNDVTQAALAVAREADAMPPIWLVTHAIDQAAKEYRLGQRFWQQRARRST